MTSVITLYNNPIRIDLTQSDKGVRNENMPLTRSDFHAYKGATTEIEFLVRNNDRKPIVLSGKNVYIIIRDLPTKSEILKKKLCITDYERARVKLPLYPSEVVDWAEGFYEYVVLVENPDSSQNILYTSQDQAVRGWFELKNGALPPLAPLYDINPQEWVGEHIGKYPGGQTAYFSDYLPGNSSFGFSTGLHTFVLYLDNYTGVIKIRGSLDLAAPTYDGDWFAISVTPSTFELKFEEASGLFPYNFYTNALWIRFENIPDQTNSGRITRLIFKP